MNNSGLPETSEELSFSSEQLSKFSSTPADDIPAAVREGAETTSRMGLRQKVVLLGGSVGFLALLGLSLVIWQARSQISLARVMPFAASTSGKPSNASKQATTASTSSDSTPSSPALLGHLPYEEASESELVPVGDGSIMLQQSAAEQFEAMVEAAKADGVNLLPLSGFRSIDEQEDVFFDIKAERGENATTRAEVSAPPGHSEHHTGYAVDIGDGYFPDADLKVSFENTPAFEWLQENAGYYSFELSFPSENSQNVSYEPWHWRYVGDRDSLETFYRARSTSTPSTTENATTENESNSP